MKHKSFVWVALCLLLAACQGKENKEQKFEERAFQMSVDRETGVHRMQQSDAQGSVQIGGANYNYVIKRSPSDELPRVKDADGNQFVDNVIDVKITRNEKNVLVKRFTKKDFSSWVEQSFLSKAILEGFVFDQVINGKMRFAASVCYPQTDIYIPLSITISTDGKLQIEKGSVLDDMVPTGGN